MMTTWLRMTALIALLVLLPIVVAAAPARAQTDDERMYCDRSSPLYDQFTCDNLVHPPSSPAEPRVSHPFFTCAQLGRLSDMDPNALSDSDAFRLFMCASHDYPKGSVIVCNKATGDCWMRYP
jgi:hypothetical protein